MGIEREDIDRTGLPILPDVTYRRLRGKDDFSQMASAMTRSREADGVEMATAVEDLAAAYEHPTDFDPASDVLVVEAYGSIIGLARTWRDRRVDGTLVYGHSVELVPEWRERGLREALFAYNERHARALAGQDLREGSRVLVLWANDEENEWKALALAHGYRPVQHEIDLVRSLEDILEAPLPAGVEVRPVTPNDYRAVWNTGREASRWMWNYSESRWDDAHFEAFKRSPEFQPDLWQIAWDGETLVATVLPFILEEENRRYGLRQGHTESVYVREGYRGKGIARALLARSLRVLKERGMEQATLGMEVENPHDPLRLYEGMGFTVVKHFTWYEKSL